VVTNFQDDLLRLTFTLNFLAVKKSLIHLITISLIPYDYEYNLDINLSCGTLLKAFSGQQNNSDLKIADDTGHTSHIRCQDDMKQLLSIAGYRGSERLVVLMYLGQNIQRRIVWHQSSVKKAFFEWMKVGRRSTGCPSSLPYTLICYHTHNTFNQSINQSVNQSINQSVSQSVTHSINQSINQSIN